MYRQPPNVERWPLTPRPRQRDLRKQATAERIYRAALTLFRDRGYGATRVEDIVRAAGVSKGTFFNYFPTKEAVLVHLSVRQMERVEAAIAAIPDFASLPVRRQFATVLEVLAAGLEPDRDLLRPVAFELYRSSTAFHDTAQIARRLFELFHRIAASGAARGELRAGAEPHSCALLVGAMYFQTFLFWLDLDSPPPLRELLQVHLDLLFEGIAAS